MVADSFIDFSVSAQFGLGTFVSVILDMYQPADPRVTLAHLDDPTGGFLADDRLARTIPNFRFDNPDHFGTDAYDVVFIFGYGANRTEDPRDHRESLPDSELEAIARYMNAGGGLFATGDHGLLGHYLGHRLPRAGRMRLWEGHTGDDNDAAMRGPNRHDTNAQEAGGSWGSSTFNHQADDRPQTISPKTFHRYTAAYRYSFPHPLLCSPLGVIRVMPDHPHEGECVEPDEVDARIHFGQDLGPEFPQSISGGERPLPEIISTNHVGAGNRALGGPNGTGADKQPTTAHSFGGICAYEGHRARVGRVVTDATWHHFVNVNLTGAQTPGKSGLLGSQQGIKHFVMIEHYYRNLVLWLCPPNVIDCILYGWVFKLVISSAVVEAVTDGAQRPVDETDVATLRYIGAHARAVLSDEAGECESRRLGGYVDLLIKGEAADPGVFLEDDDPWQPQRKESGERNDPLDIDLPLINAEVVQHISLGAALVEARNVIIREGEKLDQKGLEEAMARGALVGYRRARESARTILETTLKRL